MSEKRKCHDSETFPLRVKHTTRFWKRYRTVFTTKISSPTRSGACCCSQGNTTKGNAINWSDVDKQNRMMEARSALKSKDRAEVGGT